MCLCNLAYHGATFCQQLIQHGAFPGVISMLKDADPAAVGLVLGFSDMILKNNENVSSIVQFISTHSFKMTKYNITGEQN